MVLQPSGAISFRDLQQEYGGPANSNEGSISLSQYYLGANGNGTTTAKVPVVAKAFPSASIGAEMDISNGNTNGFNQYGKQYKVRDNTGVVYPFEWINENYNSVGGTTITDCPYYSHERITGSNSVSNLRVGYGNFNFAITLSKQFTLDGTDGQYVSLCPALTIVSLTSSGTGNTNVEINVTHDGTSNPTSFYHSEGGTGSVTGLSLSNGEQYTVNFFSGDTYNYFGSPWVMRTTHFSIANFTGSWRIRFIKFLGASLQTNSSNASSSFVAPQLKLSRSSPSGSYTYGTRLSQTYPGVENVDATDHQTSLQTITIGTNNITDCYLSNVPVMSELPSGTGVNLYSNWEDYMPKSTIAQAQAGEDGGFMKFAIGQPSSIPSSGTISLGDHYGGFQDASNVPLATFIMPDGKQHGITLTQNGVATATATAVIV